VGAGNSADAVIAVRVTPRAARDAIGSWRGGRLDIRTAAPPVDGRANDALCRLLADALGVAPSRVRVIRGTGGREKAVRVLGVPASEALRRLGHPDTA
jgi:hypothetical protein